jgi:hypothetical protein
VGTPARPTGYLVTRVVRLEGFLIGGPPPKQIGVDVAIE